MPDTGKKTIGELEQGVQVQLTSDMSLQSSFERVQIHRKVEKQTKEESSRFYLCKGRKVKILVNSCNSKMDRIGMRRSRKSCAARI